MGGSPRSPIPGHPRMQHGEPILIQLQKSSLEPLCSHAFGHVAKGTIAVLATAAALITPCSISGQHAPDPLPAVGELIRHGRAFQSLGAGAMNSTSRRSS